MGVLDLCPIFALRLFFFFFLPVRTESFNFQTLKVLELNIGSSADSSWLCSSALSFQNQTEELATTWDLMVSEYGQNIRADGNAALLKPVLRWGQWLLCFWTILASWVAKPPVSRMRRSTGRTGRAGKENGSCEPMIQSPCPHEVRMLKLSS